MSKVTIPIEEIRTGGSLQTLYYDSAIIQSQIIKTTSETEATAEGAFKMDIDDVNSILVAGGEVEGYLMAIRSPIAILNTNVPEDLPDNKKFDGTAKKFEDWFNTGVEIWKSPDNSEVIFYTNPFAGNENLYLKGSEIKIIHNLPGVNALTIADAEIITIDWIKL